MTVKLEERSVYNYVADFLQSEFGAKTLIEGRIGKGYVDIFFALDSSSFVLEIKLGKPEKKLADAIAQSWKYASELNTRNVVALVLSRVQSGQTILIENLPKLKEIILNEFVEGYIHTDYWEKWVENRTLKDVLIELYQRFYKKESEFDFNSIVKAIREIVQDLNDVIRQAKTEEIFEEVAEKLELFVGLGEIKDKQKAMGQVSMLASYLLFNQLLFYHIYKIKTKNEKIEDLKPIASVKDLKKYFSQIVDIDYQPIYAINLVDKIPENSEVVELINKVIKNLLVIRVEHVTQDLAGRFFHALLPKEVAKVWAAFYTNPIAAEILANLAIDRWDETILDPACGSGTLLAACYKRKLDLYKEKTGKELDEKIIKCLHKKFVEEDITGIDIMPFAAHLSTINLTAQRLEQPTDIVRIACMDSLELATQTLLPEFKEKGILLKPLVEKVQLTLAGRRLRIKKDMTIAPGGIGREFYIKPVDVIIMNPPFSDWQKLPKDYREKISKISELTRKCGTEVNLWGYFLSLADCMLNSNGKIASVLPISFFSGRASEKIFTYLSQNYKIKYIVKPVKAIAFSESANFKDVLFIAERGKFTENDYIGMILFKKKLEESNLVQILESLNKVKSFEEKNHYSDDLLEFYRISYSEIKNNNFDFSPYLAFNKFESKETIHNFSKLITKLGKDKITKIEEKMIHTGFITTKRGIVNSLFITNPIDESRLKRAFLILKEKNRKFLVKVKNTHIEFEIPKEKVISSLRTGTGINKINIEQMTDYLIVEGFKELEKILNLASYKEKLNLNQISKFARSKATYLALSRRVRLNSKKTHLLAFYSDEKFVPGNALYILKLENKKIAKILTLATNSILYLIDFYSNRIETTLGYTGAMKPDFMKMRILNYEKLSFEEENLLLSLFKKLQFVEFPPLIEQLRKRFWARVELDKTILKILGFSDKQIEEWLPKVYDVMVEEFRTK